MSDDDLAILVRDLRKRYWSLFGGSVHALKGISLEVRRGEVFGLLGPNGAGKTTLVKCLLGLCGITGGTARLLGRAAPDTGTRARVGYLPEDHEFPDYLTGEQCTDLFAALSGMSRAERAPRVREALDRVGLEEARERRVETYSKGMQQRVGIAQAIVHEPEVLFLDEPTDGVDPVGRNVIRDILLDLKEEGTTIFINSHILSEVEKVSDGVVILNRGHVVHAGSVEDLTATSDEVELRTDRDADEVREAIETVGRILRTPDEPGGPDGVGPTFLVGLDEMEAIDGLVDVLRDRGVGIRGIIPQRASLEDRYIDIIGEHDATGEPA